MIKKFMAGTSRAKRRFLHVRDAVNASIVMLEKYENKRVLITGNRIIKIQNLIKKFRKY